MATTPEPSRQLVALVMAQMEQLEGRQLNFGINNTRITIDYLTSELNESGENVSRNDVEQVLRYQIEVGQALEVEPGVFRSRIAETTRNIRLVRQRFWEQGTTQPQQITKSEELVEAVRTEFRQRTRPDRSITIEALIDSGEAQLDPDLRESLRWAIEEGLGFNAVAAFQRRAFKSIYELSGTNNADGRAVVVAGDTGSGKTEAFLLPILARIAQQKRELAGSRINSGVGAVLVYPRIKLALNQLQRIVKILKLWELYGGPRLTVGVQNRDVPTSINHLWYPPYKQAVQEAGSPGYVPARRVEMTLIPSPFEPSQEEYNTLSQNGTRIVDNSLVFEDNAAINAANSEYPRLVSREPQFWSPQDESTRTPHQQKLNDGVLDQLMVTKKALGASGKNPDLIPDLLIITDKSLSQYLLQPDYQHLWGTWSGGVGRAIAPPRFLVLDEVHLMNGLAGAHLSRLISRFQARVGMAAHELGWGAYQALPIGVSATLYDEAGFMAKVLGIEPSQAVDKIVVRKPNDAEGTPEELVKTTGQERYIFVRPHEIPNPETPERRVGSMSAAVQIVMASLHNLMDRQQGEKYQYKALAFFDSVNDVNLFHQFYNNPDNLRSRPGANTQELWRIRTEHRCLITQGPCRTSNVGGSQNVFYGACSRFLAGDCWIFAQRWGWDKPLNVSRPTYSGVAGDLQRTHLIPTTPALEVGYDDEAIQLVYQHMAPNNIAAFTQRRGRAGRKADQSPVIVTLLWPYRARDLFYFYRPNYLYEPTFDDIPLNARNRYVQLTHAFLAIFDWLAAQNAATGWLNVVGERQRAVLTANYTRMTDNSLTRWHLRQRQLVGWGEQIVERIEPQLRAYLAQQQSPLAYGLIDQAIELLRGEFFRPEYHRIPEANNNYEQRNFLGTFKRIDFGMQGSSGEGTIETVYPQPRNGQSGLNSAQAGPDNEPSTGLDRGLTELLPGNVTYRLREQDEAHWTPVPLDGSSTYLYPDPESKLEALHDNNGDEYSLARLQNSLMGIPSFLKEMYPGLRYFTPRRLRAERFRGSNADPQWVYDAVRQVHALLSPDTNPDTNNNLRYLDTHSQAFAQSVIVPFQPTNRGASRVARPPKQLDRIFASVNAYLENDIGYLQLFYQYTSTLRLRKRNNYDSIDTHPRLTRLFYGPESTPERRDARMAAYRIETQGLEFIVSKEFCRAVALKILTNDALRLHFRERYVAYRLGKAATSIEEAAFPLRYIQMARLVVAYWLGRKVPGNPQDPQQSLLTLDDLDAIQEFADGNTIEAGRWAGEQRASILFENFDLSDPAGRERGKRLIERINSALREGFTDSRAFRQYLETVVLHSLSVVVKNYSALLGGVSPESLVVYADLPDLDRVAQPDQPRILVLDSVSGGSGAIGQAFENLTRKPRNTKDSSDRNLWSLLQTGLGTCPVGDGETLLRRLLLSLDPATAQNLIIEVRNDTQSGPSRLRAAIEAAGFVIPDEATFETVARTIFAGEIYIPNRNLPAIGDGEPNVLDGTIPAQGSNTESNDNETLLSPENALQPPLLVHELLRQENELESRLGYRPQPEIVVAQAMETIGTGTWPHIESLAAVMRSDLQMNTVITNPGGHLRRQMTGQLLGLLPRRCVDGCPVCMVAGSNMEDRNFAIYVNSRQMLRQVRDMLLVSDVPEATSIFRELLEGKTVLFRDNIRAPSGGPGVLAVTTTSIDGNTQVTTAIPAETIDGEGKRRYLSLYRGTPVDSRGEVMIASYLDLRCKEDDWIYEHGVSRTLRDPQTKQQETVKPDFTVRVPYRVGEEEYLAEILIEFWGMENDEGYDARRLVKERCYRSARVHLIGLEPSDLRENNFITKIDDGIRAAVLKEDTAAELNLTPLSELFGGNIRPAPPSSTS